MISVARGRRRTGVAGSLLVALVALIAFAPSACKKAQSIDFEVVVPSDLAGKVAWYEIGVFSAGECASLDETLAGGIPDGYLNRVAYPPSEAAPPVLGDLTRGQYSIAVAARAADCSVLAVGCNDVDFTQASAVDIVLQDAPTPDQGACTDGTVCNDARCSPDTSGGSLGAGCSLELVGAGPFADPLVTSGGLTSAPAIAATDTGFLVAYREYDPSSGTARVTMIPVDQGGGSSTPQQAQQTACISTPESDATGLAFTGSSGVVALARGVCQGTGGVDLFAVDDTGAISTSGFASDGTDIVQLSTAHSLAASGSSTLLAFVDAESAKVATVNGTSLGPASAFGGRGPFQNAWVAATSQVVALLALAPQGTSSAVRIAAADDGGGSDGGDDGGEDGSAPSDDAGEDAATPPPTFGSVLTLNVVAAGASLSSLGAPFTLSANWGSLAAQGGRVVVASDGSQPDAPVAFTAFDLGGSGPSISNAFPVSAPGPVIYSDVAFNQDHLFFAVEGAGTIDLVALDNATTSPTPLRDVSLGADPRIPSIATVRDGRIAVVATDTRVVVAWATGQTLGPSDAVGGYAVFACTTP